MSRFNRQYVGSVRVKTGRLMIADPERLPENNAWINMEVHSAVSNEDGAGPLKDGVAVALSVPHKDGEYAVWATYDDQGFITGVEIDFQLLE